MEFPKECLLSVIDECNLRCSHCYLGKKPKKDHFRLSTKSWFNVIENLSSAGVEKCVLLGGEPLYHPGFWDILQYAMDKFKMVTIETNGTVQSEFSDYKKATVSVSFEHWVPEINDSIRGMARYREITYEDGKKKIAEKEAGVFELAIRKLKMINNPKIMRYSYYLNSDIYGSVYLAESLGASSVFVPLIPFGEAEKMMFNVPTSEKLLEGFRDIHLLNASMYNTHTFLYPQYYLYDDSLKERFGNVFLNRGRICPMALGRVYIDSKGRTTPCNFISDINVGSILKKSVKHIYQDLHKFSDDMKKIPIAGKCRNCHFIRLCDGGGVCSYYKKGIKTGGNCPIPDSISIQEQIKETYRRYVNA